MKNENEPFGGEHTLVCLSASPSNPRIIKTAAKMAKAFGGSFTALYVHTPDADKMNKDDEERLKNNIRLAEKSGADITTVYGDDVYYQIAEFARISGVTRIVIGRSNVNRRHFWNKPTLTEKLTEVVPNIDIHIIPDNSFNPKYRESTRSFFEYFIPYPKDLLVSLFILMVATLTGLAFYRLGFTDSNIITVYIFGVLLMSLYTKGYACGIIGSFMSVALFNFIFTDPRLSFTASDSGYPVTFAVMLASSILTGTLASKLKTHAKLSAQTAFRTKVLLDTNQLLQKAQDNNDIINITASQITKLLNRSVVIYLVTDASLSKGYLFSASSQENDSEMFTPTERRTAEWVYKNNHRAGATTDKLNDAKCLYLTIRINSKIYGVIGIRIGSKPLDSFENSILLSILGECALALENSYNAKEKEASAILAKNEQLRANLLRAISHDLRTPLTSISSNAGSLLTNYDKLDEETRVRAFKDIYNDSQWLIGLVENLLSITRIEQGKISFNMSVHLMDEVIEEALKHINPNSGEHHISVEYGDELLLARMDAKLIIQVIVNLVDNAVKYTPAGSEIKISAGRADGFVFVSVADNGEGIPDEFKARVFEMFYTGNSKIADSRRSLGLGLSVCKSIINAHDGEIKLKDNDPSGCVFTFTIPSEEVVIDEQASDSGS